MLRIAVSMACAALLAACVAPPASTGPDLSLTRVSPNGHFVVTLVPPARIPLQEIHEWRVKLATRAGEPVTGALVYVNGGMPGHGHGLPTRPVVTREVEPGTYLIEGMKFSMGGWWEVLIAAQKVPASDVTSFNVMVETAR
jgi:YtkA-like